MNNKKTISTGKYIKEKQLYLHKYICKECLTPTSFIGGSKNMPISGLCKKCRGMFCNVRPVSLRHFKTNKIVNEPSITIFCRKRQHLGKFARHHFTDVLNGKRQHYKGWMLPENTCVSHKIVKQYYLEIKKINE